MKKILTSLVLVFMFFSQSAFASFGDVESDASYSTAVQWLQKNGVVQGYSDGTFRPGVKITRAEFLKMLYATVGGAMNSEVKLPFKDVPAGEWYSKYVREAYANGIIEGYSDGTFKPNQSINWPEAVKIVTNIFFDVDKLYNGGGKSNFAGCQLDFDQINSMWGDQWYFKYLYVSDNLCILPDYSAYGFSIDMDFNRSDMAELIYRTKAVHDYEAQHNEYKKYDENMKPADLLTFNEFDVADLKVGMKVGDLTVKSFGPFDADFGSIAYNNLKVVFEGETTVTGKYTDYDASEGFGGIWTCFYPNAKSSAELPHVKMDEVSEPWFCFNNQDFAQSKLGKNKTVDGVTVMIKNYTYIRYPSEVAPTADLVWWMDKVIPN